MWRLFQTLKAIVKKSLLYVPGLGMIFYANEYLFLDRKWAADQPKMTAMLKQSQQFPYPISVSTSYVLLYFEPIKLMSMVCPTSAQSMA